MSKFKVGQKVLVKDSTFYPSDQTRAFIGKAGYIKEYTGSVFAVWNQEKTDWFGFNESDLQPITEHAKEITLNGVTYVLKEEPKHEHEWKFVDIAVHEEYGVVFVGRESNFKEGYIWVVVDKGYGEHVSHKALTFLRRADLSV